MAASSKSGFAEVCFGKTHYFKENKKGDLRSLCGRFQWLDPILGLNTKIFESMPPSEFMCKTCERKFKSLNSIDAPADL